MHDLNDKEQLVFNMIEANPYVSQQDIAEAIQLSRPSVANIISGLVKKDYIFGKAYVLNDDHPIICIGGANVDRKFYAKETIKSETSNPVTSSITVGGVARNMAENLGRLGEDAMLFSASGTDSEWQIIHDASSSFMNLDAVSQFDDASTGSYTAILDPNGNLFTALADMDIYEKITPELLTKHSATLQKAKSIVVDLNCPKKTIDFLCSFTNKHAIPLIVIPVSAPKMNRLPQALHSVQWLILNKAETETYMRMTITSHQDYQTAIHQWKDLGVQNVIITNGADGAVAGDKDGNIFFYSAIDTPSMVDVTGAGDAFCSAVVHSWLQGLSFDDIVVSGMVNAHKTISSTDTVRQELSKKQLKHEVEDLNHEELRGTSK